MDESFDVCDGLGKVKELEKRGGFISVVVEELDMAVAAARRNSRTRPILERINILLIPCGEL